MSESVEEATLRDMTSADRAPACSSEQLERYNYSHFWMKHLVADLWRSARGSGLRGGSEAPDFELDTTDGDKVTLSSLRGRPVLLHFGSAT